MTDDLALQNSEMRARGLGWKAVRCVDPLTCDDALCVMDADGRPWHPVDPLAFAKWRVRANPDTIPAHVLVQVASASRHALLKRGLLLGALGLGLTAAALGVHLGRQWRAHRAAA